MPSFSLRLPRREFLFGVGALALTPAAYAAMSKRRSRQPQFDANGIPLLNREFRAAWVATVENIDWPTKRGEDTDTQKRQLLAILDKAVNLRLNALIFQVRPCCDALYDSPHEPWSEYITGTQGRAPEPYYDPLAFVIEEAHRRGIELHAWFNPYRAKHPSGKSALAQNHVSRTRPDLVRPYGAHLWLDPGEPDVRDHTLRVVMDVVNRYDVDGIHLDDYFYPYKETDKAGHTIEFPDGPSYHKHQEAGGTLTRDDFRRENVNLLIEAMYRQIKAAKPWVKFGISPFGIWRPKNPAQIKGFDAYAQIYADSKKWLNQGWLDYWTPQLYWKIEQTAQSFPVLLNWWIGQNTQNRHVWPGMFTSRVAEAGKSAWPISEVAYQIKTARGYEGATGHVHFSMKTLLKDSHGLSRHLAEKVYTDGAAVPASPWLGSDHLSRPEVNLQPDPDSPDRTHLAWSVPTEEADRVRQWTVQAQIGGIWKTWVFAGQSSAWTLPGPAAQVGKVAVSALDRCGNQSGPVVFDTTQPNS